MIAFESTLERDFVTLQNFNLGVSEVVSQPCEVPYIQRDGRSNIYTPDYLVIPFTQPAPHWDLPRPVLVEVKYAKEWRQHWRDWLPKWKAARRYAIGQGWQFRIHDESRIRGQSLANIKFLDRYKRAERSPEQEERVLETLREMGGAPIHYLLARLFMGEFRARGVAIIWQLLTHRQLDCDITQPLSNFTEVWIPAP